MCAADGTLQLLLPLMLLLSPASGQTEPAEVGEWLAVVAASTDVSNSTKDALRQTCNLAQAAWSTPQDRHRLLDALHDAAADHAIADSQLLADDLRASLRAEAADIEDICNSADGDLASWLGTLPAGARSWLHSLRRRAHAAVGVEEVARGALSVMPAEAWTSPQSDRAVVSVYDAITTFSLDSVARLVQALRTALDKGGEEKTAGAGRRQGGWLQKKHLVRETAVRIAWDHDMAHACGRVGDVEGDACDTVEAGVDYPSVAFEMFRRVASWRDCCALCRRDPGCVYWTWASFTWQVEMQRGCCWLKPAAAKHSRAQLEPSSGATIYSGSVPPALLQTATSYACRKLPTDLGRNRPARTTLQHLQHAGRDWTGGAPLGAPTGSVPATAPGAPGDDSIPKLAFFIHHYGTLTNDLNLCAIESFLARNPGHRVLVFAKNVQDFRTRLAAHAAGRDRANVSEPGEQLSDAWGMRRRVEVRKIRFGAAFRGTPLHEWYQSGVWKTATRKELDLCDALRLALLYSLGGTYLDLDVISFNRLDGLGRTMAAVDEGATEAGHLLQDARAAPWGGLFFIGNALFRFPPKDPFVLAVMEALPRYYDAAKWANTGPYLVTRVYEQLCRGGRLGQKGVGCESLTVLEPRALCPVCMFNLAVLTRRWEERCYQMRDMARGSFGLHWWNSAFSRAGRLQLQSESMLAKIAAMTCPRTYAHIQPMLLPASRQGHEYSLEAARDREARGRLLGGYDAALAMAKGEKERLAKGDGTGKSAEVYVEVVAQVRLELAEVATALGASAMETLAIEANLSGVLLDAAHVVAEPTVYAALYREAITRAGHVVDTVGAWPSTKLAPGGTDATAAELVAAARAHGRKARRALEKRWARANPHGRKQAKKKAKMGKA